MKKKFMLLILLFGLMVGLNPHSITQAQTTITQGEQFEQGKYDLQAEFPFGQNWNRNSPYAGTETNKIKWEYKVNYNDGYTIQQFYSNPAIGRDGTIYVSNQNGKLFALNKDGSVKWAKEKMTTMYCPPVIAEDGTIYVAGYYLTALNPDGSIKWQVKDSDTNIQETPVLDGDGTIYVRNIKTARLEAYNPDGSKKWSSNEIHEIKDGGGDVYIRISKDGTIYTLVSRLSDKHLYAHDKTGKELWEKYVRGEYHGDGFALGLNNEIFVNTQEDIYVFDKNGNIVHQWKAKDKEKSLSLLSAPTVSSTDGTIYVGGEGYIYAYNPDYSLKWKYPILGDVWEAPVIDKNGVIYFITTREMYALKPDATLKWKIPDLYPNRAFRQGGVNNSIVIDKDGTIYNAGSGGSGKDGYYSLIAIGDSYIDNVCKKESTFMEVLKSLEAKSKNAKLTEDEKKEARNILNKISSDLDNTEK